MREEKNAAPAAVAGPAQCPTSVDAKTMELAESVGLIGPASRVHDLHAAIQRFHDLICVNATIKAAVMSADVIRGAATSVRDYPPLPMQFACSGVFPVYSADQMRAYVDADRAARAPADSVTAPAAGVVAGPEDGDSLMLCASDLEHSAIYDNHVEMQSCIRAVAARVRALAAAPTTQAAPQPAVQPEPVAGVILDPDLGPALVQRGSEDSHITKFGGKRLYTAAPVAHGDAEDAARWRVINEQFIDDYLEDYDLIGEAEGVGDCCYTPTETERFLIKDAVLGLLSCAEDAARAQAKEGGA